MQTPPLLILLGWSARTELYPSISSRPSSFEDSRYVSDEHIKSCLYTEIHAFNCVTFEKIWADKLFKSTMADRIVLSGFSLKVFKISLDMGLVQDSHGTVKDQKYTEKL